MRFAALIVCAAATVAVATSMQPMRSFPAPNMQVASFSESGMALVNTLCLETHQEDAEKRDACYGCFIRVGNCNQTNKSLEALQDCSARYLSDTKYESCSENLKQNQVDEQEESISEPFCKYETCIRKVHMGRLIEKCVTEVSEQSIDGAEKYISTTICVLAKLRCQDKCGKRPQPYASSEPAMNGLLVTEDREIRVMPIYSHQMNGYQCSSRQYIDPMSHVKQADWPSAQCDA